MVPEAAPPRAVWEEVVVADGNGVPRWVEEAITRLERGQEQLIAEAKESRERVGGDLLEIKLSIAQQRERMLGWARLQGTLFGALVTILVALLVNWLTKKP